MLKDVFFTPIVNIIGSSQSLKDHIENNQALFGSFPNVFINKSGIFLRNLYLTRDFWIFQDVDSMFKLSPKFYDDLNYKPTIIASKFTQFQIESRIGKSLKSAYSKFYLYDYIPRSNVVNSTLIPSIRFCIDKINALEINFFGCDFTEQNIFDEKLGFNKTLNDTYKHNVMLQVNEIIKQNPNIKFNFLGEKHEI